MSALCGAMLGNKKINIDSEYGLTAYLPDKRGYWTSGFRAKNYMSAVRAVAMRRRNTCSFASGSSPDIAWALKSA
jgi:hypothetical protein